MVFLKVILFQYACLQLLTGFKNWNIDVEKAYSFKIVESGSKILIDEFPKYDDIENTKDKIDKI